MIVEPNGAYPIVSFDAEHDWGSLPDLTYGALDAKGMGRLQTLLAPTCKCVVVERSYIDKDYRDTFSNFHSKKFITPPARCTRLHFFDAIVAVSDFAEIDASTASHDGGSINRKLQNAYLGYSVIRPTKPNCIGRTLIADRLRSESKAHLTVCKEDVNLLGCELGIQGFPFISQDCDATVCAESALWMLLRYYSTKYSTYSEILPFQITNLASHHAAGKRVYPSGGLYSWQLSEALRLQRFSPVIYSRRQYPNFDHLLYTYIESGLPLLVTVPRHVVAAYGHWSDYSKSSPGIVVRWMRAFAGKADFVYTSYFNEAYVVSDDNHFPYQLLRRNGPKKSEESPFCWDQLDEFIVPLPEKVFLSAEQAQSAIESLLQNPDVGLAKYAPDLASQKLVFRLFLTSSKAFKRRLSARGMGHPAVANVYRRLPMPHFIWVCEIAEYDAYAQSKAVVGEVIWDATRNAQEARGWIALHYPQKLLVDLGAAVNGQHDPRTVTLQGATSYSLFVSNLHSLSR